MRLFSKNQTSLRNKQFGVVSSTKNFFMGLKSKAIILIISAAAAMSVGCGKKEDYGVPRVQEQIQQQQAQINALQAQLQQAQAANVSPQYQQPQVIVQQVPVPQQQAQSHDSGPGIGSTILGTAVGSAIGTVAGNAVSSAIAERKSAKTINQSVPQVTPDRKTSWFSQRSEVQKPVDNFNKPATVPLATPTTPKPTGGFWSSAAKSTTKSSSFGSSSRSSGRR